jgi:hypothetical protein
MRSGDRQRAESSKIKWDGARLMAAGAASALRCAEALKEGDMPAALTHLRRLRSSLATLTRLSPDPTDFATLRKHETQLTERVAAVALRR